MGRLAAEFRDVRGTLAITGGTLLAALVVVVIFLAMRSTGPSGDITVTETNFRISMPRTLRAGRHTFAFTNNGSVGHELLLFRTDLSGGALPLRSDGNVNEESPLLHKVVDSGNATKPGGSEAVPTSGPLPPGHFVAVCNLPGHYHLGMWLNVTTTR